MKMTLSDYSAVGDYRATTLIVPANRNWLLFRVRPKLRWYLFGKISTVTIGNFVCLKSRFCDVEPLHPQYSLKMDELIKKLF